MTITFFSLDGTKLWWWLKQNSYCHICGLSHTLINKNNFLPSSFTNPWQNCWHHSNQEADLVWFGMVCYGMVFYCLVRFDMFWYDYKWMIWRKVGKFHVHTHVYTCYTPGNGLVVFATHKNPHYDLSLTYEWQFNQKLQLEKLSSSGPGPRSISNL